MQTDRLQGIIFKRLNQSTKNTFDKESFANKYFRQLLGYAVPGHKERLKIERRYSILQNECDQLIAADLFERLHIPSDKIDIVD